MPRGYVRLDADLQTLFQRGYLKLTDMERYWRLPTPYSRRLFQYLDKHRGRALRERGGCFTIGIYLLAKKLGTLDQTLQSYRPAKLRGILATHLDTLVSDGFLESYRFVKERGRQSEEVKHKLEVKYAPQEANRQPLPEREAAAVARIGLELRDALSRRYHETVVRELGAERALAIMRDVLARAEVDPKTHRGKLFTYLAQQARRG